MLGRPILACGRTLCQRLCKRDGYLWVGIHEGLARFDGVRFTVINRANTPANASNRVLGLYEDCEGRLFGYCSSYKEQRKNQSGLFPARLPEVRPPNLSRVHSLFNLLLAMGPGNYVDHYKQGQEIPCNYSCIGLPVDSHFVALLAKPHTYDERLLAGTVQLKRRSPSPQPSPPQGEGESSTVL
jgi:hypothetical protein